MWKLKPCSVVIDLDHDSDDDATRPASGKSILVKLEKSRVIQKEDMEATVAKNPVKKEPCTEKDIGDPGSLAKRKVKLNVREDDKKKSSTSAAAGCARSTVTDRGAYFHELWRPHQGFGACRNTACIFGTRGDAAPAGSEGLCDLCNFADMPDLFHHGRGRLTHLLLRLPEHELGVALSRIGEELGEEFVAQLRQRIQRGRHRRVPDRPRRGPRGPYKKK